MPISTPLSPMLSIRDDSWVQARMHQLTGLSGHDESRVMPRKKFRSVVQAMPTLRPNGQKKLLAGVPAANRYFNCMHGTPRALYKATIGKSLGGWLRAEEAGIFIRRSAALKSGPDHVPAGEDWNSIYRAVQAIPARTTIGNEELSRSSKYSSFATTHFMNERSEDLRHSAKKWKIGKRPIRAYPQKPTKWG